MKYGNKIGNMRKLFTLSCLYLILLSADSYSQTIAEKKAGTVFGEGELTRETQDLLVDVNKQLTAWQDEIKELYAQVLVLFQRNAPICDYKNLLDEINQIKENIYLLESTWRDTVSQGGSNEAYSLWHQPSTTIEQLVIDYGSQNFVYLVRPDVAGIKVSINSSLPIPRASWNLMLETILAQNGIGFKQLNPYLRELYLVKQDNSGIELITNNRRDLDLFPENARVCFVLTPDAADARRIWLFLDKFINQNTTVMQMIGRDILLISQVSEIRDLLKLYDFVAANRGDKEYKIIPLAKVEAEEMSRIIAAVFDQLQESPKTVEQSGNKKKESNGGGGGMEGSLKVLTLGKIAQALFIVGTKEEIRKAEEIIRRVESQVGEARARTIYWYTARNSDPEELADVLYRVYSLMMEVPMPPEGQGGQQQAVGQQQNPTGQNPQRQDININQEVSQRPQPPMLPPPPPPPTSLRLYAESFYQDGGYIVNPAPAQPGLTPAPVFNEDRDNFIVDPKTNSIVMVVEADILPKLKEVIYRLDVPKKMVQIEVLFFEKRANIVTDYGLNLLRLGNCASNTDDTCFAFNNVNTKFRGRPENAGVFQFFLSHAQGCSGIPSFDYFYRFLVTRQDVQINSNPSVTTMNQTPALITIRDEISINTGIFEVETAKGVTLKDAFTRAQYGITVAITPTIHMHGEEPFEDPHDYVTMITDITFSNVQPTTLFNRDRPDVAIRQVKNVVRVPDGQSVIIGGLRRKTKHDEVSYVPLIGELPGIGKLFSITGIRDEETEMYMFITPKIIVDPVEDFDRLRRKELCRRPGDIPAYLCQLNYAQECERTRVLEQSMRMLFGRPINRCIYTEDREYHGKCW